MTCGETFGPTGGGDASGAPRPAADAAPLVLVGGRLAAIDFLRGIVMVLMVLDHTREFIGDPNVDPTDLAKTTVPLFLTRWVTHFCAPIFVLLAGTGAYLARAVGKEPTPRALAGFLASRGLFLVALEFTLVRWGWNLNFNYHFILVQVIWAIGLSMLILAALVAIDVPSRWIGVLGVILIIGHNLLDLSRFSVNPGDLGRWSWLWSAFVRPGAIQPAANVTLLVAYPVLPWFGIMAVGFALGEVMIQHQQPRIRITAALGLALSLLLVVLRLANTYGDPTPWKAQETAVKTVLSFINCQKYPPSLLYVLMTIGPGLLALAAFDSFEGRRARPVGRVGRVLVTLGRVPLFYYLLQWPVTHMAANLAFAFTGQSVNWFVWPIDFPAGSSFSLPVVYAIWILVVAILYFPSSWFANLKRKHRDNVWLSYF
jgi:uncharacterized membrane protein